MMRAKKYAYLARGPIQSLEREQFEKNEFTIVS